MVATYAKKAKTGLLIWGAVFIFNLIVGLILAGSIFSQALNNSASSVDISKINQNPFVIASGYISLAGYLALFYGLYNLLKAKGYSGWLCLLGLFQIIGLIIVALLKDRTDPANKKKNNRWLIVAIVVIGLIFILQIVSSLVLQVINPQEQFKKAEIIMCTNQCKDAGDNMNVCMNDCTSKSTIDQK